MRTNGFSVSPQLRAETGTMMATACHNDSHLLNTLGLNGIHRGDSMDSMGDVHNAIGGLSDKTCVDHLTSMFSTIND